MSKRDEMVAPTSHENSQRAARALMGYDALGHDTPDHVRQLLADLMDCRDGHGVDCDVALECARGTDRDDHFEHAD